MFRILVCDSASIIQFVLQRYLSDQGVEIDYAKAPRDMIECLREKDYHLAFIEAEISGGRGKRVCEFLAKNAKTSKIPIILSTRLSEEHLNDLKQWPNVRYVVKKPLSFQKVLDAIEEIRHCEESQAIHSLGNVAEQ